METNTITILCRSSWLAERPVSSKAADPQNSRLEPFAESQVKVTGVHRMSHGMHTIEIKTIAAAT